MFYLTHAERVEVKYINKTIRTAAAFGLFTLTLALRVLSFIVYAFSSNFATCPQIVSSIKYAEGTALLYGTVSVPQ